MDIKEIEKIIRKAFDARSELSGVEFKDARGGFPTDPVAKTLSAFGNSKGGMIVFGVLEHKDRSLEIVGTQDAAIL